MNMLVTQLPAPLRRALYSRVLNYNAQASHALDVARAMLHSECTSTSTPRAAWKAQDSVLLAVGDALHAEMWVPEPLATNLRNARKAVWQAQSAYRDAADEIVTHFIRNASQQSDAEKCQA